MTKKIQRREIVIREFEDNSFQVEGSAWKLDLKEDEIGDFFTGWKDKKIKDESPLKLGDPKLIKDSKK